MLRGLPFLALTAAASTSNLDATEARRLNPIADPLKDGLRGIDTDLKIGAWESADPLAKYVKREFNMDCFSSDLYKLILDRDPVARPGAKEIAAHAFFAPLDWTVMRADPDPEAGEIAPGKPDNRWKPDISDCRSAD